MNRFIIGHFNKFDYTKQNKDFNDEFWGVEVCNFESLEEIDKLKNESKSKNFNIGVHFPLKSGDWRLRDPQFLCKNHENRKSSYEYMEKQFQLIKDIGGKYVLFHYPKPVILDERVDWTNWRFEDNTEFCFEKDYTFEYLKEESEKLFEYLNNVSLTYGLKIILELDAINRYIYDSNFLEELLEKYTNIKLCLDTGRLHIQEVLDSNFDSFKAAEKFAKYTELVHLWNVKVTEKVECSHYPALPNLKIEEGWAHIEKYLSIINKENKDFKILFEHDSSLISENELNRCYEWIMEIIS